MFFMFYVISYYVFLYCVGYTNVDMRIMFTRLNFVKTRDECSRRPIVTDVHCSSKTRKRIDTVADMHRASHFCGRSTNNLRSEN